MSPRHMVIPVFIPHKGCPFDCIYCNQKTISGQVQDMSEENMRSIIEAHLASASEGVHTEIGFYGGSFTGIDRGQQIKFLEVANEYVNMGRVKGIRLSTRPDYISREILDYLRDYNVKTIELGVQSLEQEVLDKTCRGHSVDSVIEAAYLIKEHGINLGIQTMIGLPASDRLKEMDTAKRVVELEPAIVRIYPTLVIRATYLEKMYYEGQYTPLSLYDAVEISSGLLELYESHNMKVIRIGLQPTDNINENMDVVAGPFHPAFRQLVESRLVLKRMEKYIMEYGLDREKSIEIHVHSKNISNVVGQGKVNIDYLKAKFGYDRVSVVGDGCGGEKEFWIHPPKKF